MTTIYERIGKVLDHSTTVPAADVRVEAWATFAGVDRPVAHAKTDSDGLFRVRVATADLTELLGDVQTSLFFRVVEDVSGTDKYTADTKDSLRWVLGQERQDVAVIFRDRDNPLTGTPSGEFRVVVRLINDGTPISDGNIKIYDANATSDTLMVTASTMPAPGTHEVTYSESLITTGKRLADLKVVYEDRFGVPQATSDVLFQAPPTATMTLVVGTSSGTTAASAISSAITGVLAGANPRDLSDSEVDHVARSAEIPASRMRIWSKTDAIANATELTTDDAYGALSQGLPQDQDELLARPPIQIRRALVAASARGEIDYDAAAITSALQRFRDSAAAASSGEFDSLLVQAGVSNSTTRSDFIDAYSGHEGSVEDFWANQTVLTGNDIPNVQDRFQVAAATRYHFDLLDNANFTYSFETLAEWDEDDWVDFLDGSLHGQAAISFPSWSGDSGTWTTSSNYVQLVTRAHEDALPTRALRGRLTNAEPTSLRSKFLQDNIGQSTEHPDFDFRVHRVRTFIDQYEAVLNLSAGSTDAYKSALLPLERLFKVTHRWDHISALEGTFQSARSIAQYGRAKFVADFGGNLGTDEAADLIYQRAQQVAFRSQALDLVLNPNLHENSPPWLPDMLTPKPDPGPITSSWDAYFGNGSFCICDRCGAVHGPAAYFVDLLLWLRGFASDLSSLSGRDLILGSTSPSHTGRRPDLGHIALNCSNVNERVPYIDLVNEALEWRVADFSSWSTITTTGTEAQRLAAPRVGDEAAFNSAYNTLKDGVYPWNLPFSLPHVQARTYLDHLGVPRHELMKLMQVAGQPLDALIAAEAHGLTPVSRELVVGQASTNDYTHWGYATAAPNGDWWDDLKVVKTFVQRSGLTFAEVQAVVESQFAKALENSNGLGFSAPVEDVFCDLSNIDIAGFESPALAYEFVHRFLRLRQHLGLAIPTLDAAVHTFGGIIHDGLLVSLMGARSVAARLKREVHEVLPWWGPIDTHVRVETHTPSLYESQFQSGAGGTLEQDDLPDAGTDVPKLPGCVLWLRADIQARTANQAAAADTDDVAIWRDLSPRGDVFLETNGADQPTYATNVASLDGHAEVGFDDVTALMKLTSSTSDSAYRCLHDGSGSTVFCVFRPTGDGVLFATHNYVATDTGFAVDYISSDVICRVGNGSGTWLINMQTTTDEFPASQANLLTVQVGAELDTNAEMRSNGTPTVGTDFTGSPSTGAATTALTVGNRSTGNVTFGGGIAEIIIFDRLLSPTELVQVEGYLQARYGLGTSEEGLHSLSPNQFAPITRRALGLSTAAYGVLTSSVASESPLVMTGPASGSPPSLDQLSALYRYATLADALDVSVSDATVLGMLMPTWSTSPSATQRLLDAADRLDAFGLSVSDVHYLLRHVEAPENGVLPRQAKLNDAVLAVHAVLDSIVEDTRPPEFIDQAMLRDALRGALDEVRAVGEGVTAEQRARAIDEDVDKLVTYIDDTTLADTLGTAEASDRREFVDALFAEMFATNGSVFSAFLVPDEPSNLESCATWCDSASLSGNENDAVQTWSARGGGTDMDGSVTQAEQPTLALEPLKGLRFGAATTGMTSATSFTDEATVLCVFTPNDAESYAVVRAGGVTLTNRVPDSNPGRAGYSSNAGWQTRADARTGTQMLTMRVSSAKGHLFVDGAPEEASAASGVSLSGTVLLGTDDSPTTAPTNLLGVVHAFGVFASTLTMTELAQAQGFAAAVTGNRDWRRNFVYRALTELRRRQRVAVEIPVALAGQWDVAVPTTAYLLETMASTTPSRTTLLADFAPSTIGGHVEPSAGVGDLTAPMSRFEKAAMLASTLGMTTHDVTWLMTRPSSSVWAVDTPSGAGIVALPPWLGYTCPTSGTSSRVGSSTVRTRYAANAPRAYSDDGILWGMLVEATATNLVNNQDISTWSAGGGGPADVTVITGPDRHHSGYEVTDDHGTDDEYRHYSNGTALASTVYTSSAWLQILGDGPITVSGSTNHIATNPVWLAGCQTGTSAESGWIYRHSSDPNIVEHTPVNHRVYPRPSTDDTGSMRVAFVQLEAGSYPTSFIGADGVNFTRAAATLGTSTSVVADGGHFDVTVTYRPQYANDEVAGDHNIVYVDDDNRLYFKESTDAFVLRLDGQDVITTGSWTFARDDELTVRVQHLATGSALTVEGPSTSEALTSPAASGITGDTIHFFGSPEVEEGVVLRSIAWSNVSRWPDLDALPTRRPTDDGDLPLARTQFQRLLHLRNRSANHHLAEAGRPSVRARE